MSFMLAKLLSDDSNCVVIKDILKKGDDMPIPDLPPTQHQQERIVCSITAAEKYHIPANILLAIAEKEGVSRDYG